MDAECFVTGGSGFVGQHLLARLTARGHKTWVLLRDPQHLARLREQVGHLGGDPFGIHAVQGDISQHNLGLSVADRERVSSASVIFHLAAQFSWGMTIEQARAVNVDGALRVAELAANQRSRLLMVGGYMLQNFTHLANIGVNHKQAEKTDWPAVYDLVGGYEGSKIESHFSVIHYMEQRCAEYNIVHPATVYGHSESGHMVKGQPVAELIQNLARGKLKAIPGSPMHWLPLVSVDYLVSMIDCVAFDPLMINQQVLALDERTPNLKGLLARIARPLGVAAPRLHITIRVLRWVLNLPGMAVRFATNSESLNFIQKERFDMSNSKRLEMRYHLKHPDMERTLEKTTLYVKRILMG